MSDEDTAQPVRGKKAVRDEEKEKEKGVALRAFFYIFGTHLFAAFVWLLFYVGQHAGK
ncbi:DUF6126 family protein [Streptomyces sp. NPDC058195]|uniref:DUF6126 family protein n=1 Tax=Streptomyces sp. NPDC058195 TaxID=3346375 RepID=UPI0036E9BFAB